MGEVRGRGRQTEGWGEGEIEEARKGLAGKVQG